MSVTVNDPTGKLNTIIDTVGYTELGRSLIEQAGTGSVTVQYGDLSSQGGGGAFDPTTNTITIDPKDDFNQQILDLAHELSHAADFNTSPEAFDNARNQTVDVPSLGNEPNNQEELMAYEAQAGIAYDLGITSSFRGPDWFTPGQLSSYDQFSNFAASITDTYQVSDPQLSGDPSQPVFTTD